MFYLKATSAIYDGQVVRQVIRAPFTLAFRATMEEEYAQEEEQLFEQLPETRILDHRHNNTAGGNRVAWLNAERGKMLGPSRTQEVQEGDSLTLEVDVIFDKKRKGILHPSALIKSGSQTLWKDRLLEGVQNLNFSPEINPMLIYEFTRLLLAEIESKKTPESYLMYALYDQDSVLYDQGKVLVSNAAANEHEQLRQTLKVKKNGYLETFVVNETAQNIFFDNLKVQSTSPIIVQENAYYPFGMTIAGLDYSYNNHTNRYLYNGKELIEDLNLGLYDYGARMYDPAIGRWISVDPLAEERSWVSPYNFVQNNPLNRIDPDGALDNPIVNSQGEFLGYDELGAGGEAIVYDGAFKEGMSQDEIFNNGGQFATDFFIGNNFNMGDALDFQSKANQSFKDKRNTEALLATGDLIGDISTGLSFMTGGAGGARVAARSGLMARGVGNQALTASPRLFKATEQTSRSAVKRIAQSMSQSGWQGEAIHAYKLKDGTFAILNGHHRVQAATRAGIDVQYKVLNFTEAQSLYGWKSEAEIIMSIIR